MPPADEASARVPWLVVLFTLSCATALAASQPTTATGARALARSQPTTATAARALAYVRAHATALGVSAADLSDLAVTGETANSQTGVTHVYVRQRVRGIEIVGADITVSIARDGSIVHQAGALVPRVATAANRPRSTLTKHEAATRAAKHVGVTLSDAERKTRPAKLVYHPTAPGTLRLAWQVDVETSDGAHEWVITVDAVSGAVLDKFDRVVSGYNSGDEHLPGGVVSPVSGVAGLR